MPTEKVVIKTPGGKEITITEQTPIPCFRCGICCTCYQAPLTPEGYLLKHTKKGCVFLAWDADGKARCTIHPSRPKACREWTPSLAKPECLEGLAKLKSEGQIMLLEELFSSHKDRQDLYSSLEGEAPDA
jgi:Fe-S-cluster containining protein